MKMQVVLKNLEILKENGKALEFGGCLSLNQRFKFRVSRFKKKRCHFEEQMV